MDDVLSFISNFSFSLFSKITIFTPFVSQNKIVDVLFNLFRIVKKYRLSSDKNRFSEKFLKIFFMKEKWFLKIKQYCIQNLEEGLSWTTEIIQIEELRSKLYIFKIFNFRKDLNKKIIEIRFKSRTSM